MARETARDAEDGGFAERTVLFADIAGSTRLLSEIGDERGRIVLNDCLERMAAVVRDSGGANVELRGDEIMCVFATPDVAAETALAMAALVAGNPVRADADHRIRLRIGFVHGPVIETAGAPFGATVHLAARVAALAKSGQVLTTKETLRLLGARWQRASRYHDRRVLKGLPGEQEIHELLPETDVTSLRRVPRPDADPTVDVIELAYRGRVVQVDASCPRVELGREDACDLCVEGIAVSRLHAIVEWDAGRARLEDVSTNGTLVEPVSAPAIHVHHRSASLDGHGELRLGSDAPEEQCARVSYRCVPRRAAPP